MGADAATDDERGSSTVATPNAVPLGSPRRLLGTGVLGTKDDTAPTDEASGNETDDGPDTSEDEDATTAGDDGPDTSEDEDATTAGDDGPDTSEDEDATTADDGTATGGVIRSVATAYARASTPSSPPARARLRTPSSGEAF